jgi:UDP-N-acetylmuramoylalanine--D-glutamate ligase
MGNTTFPRNLELAMDAALAADNSLTLAHVLDALHSTQPLPSRQQLVATKGDRQFVDDALASNPLGVIAAIERFDHSRFVLIMGGEDRNVDFGPLCNAVNAAQHLGAIVVLGAPSTRLYKELLTTRATVCPANSDNVADAVEIAVSLTQSGDRVVFSPGAPTPRDIGDYRTRSAQFAAGIDRITFS